MHQFANKEKTIQDKKFIFLLTLFIIMLVGSTGWFLSPFFFVLYLVGIYLAFVIDLPASIAYVITLVILFSFNIGEIDIIYDFLIVLSLLTVIPLSMYLRSKYLELKEQTKEILIIEEGSKKELSKIEKILSNKISHFVIDIKEPINDVKQIAYLLDKTNSKEEIKKYQTRIIALAENAIRQLKTFETTVTGRKILERYATPQGQREDQKESESSETTKA